MALVIFLIRYLNNYGLTMDSVSLPSTRDYARNDKGVNIFKVIIVHAARPLQASAERLQRDQRGFVYL